MRREGRICSHTGGEQKVKAEGRKDGYGGEERERERESERARGGDKGGLLLPLYNEWGEMPHIWWKFIHFIMLYVGAPWTQHIA